VLLFVALAPLIACAEPDPEIARREWMRDQLTDENALWLLRDPALVADKYAVMAADPYDFVRGSAGFWYTDLARPGADRPPTAFLDTPEATAVLLVGDPHPENLGTCAPDDTGAVLTIEFVDLDGSVFGPWLADVRRAALGLTMFGDAAFGCDGDCLSGAVAAFAAAYADEIATRAKGGPGWDAAAETPTDPAIVAELRAGARADAGERKAMRKYTRPGADHRVFAHLPVNRMGKGLAPLTEAEAAQLDRLLAAWTRRPDGFRVLDTARRYGSGVASLPAVRYAVLWDRGGEGDDDDALLNVREVIDPAPVPGRVSSLDARFDDNVERVDDTAAFFWSRPHADPLHDGLADGLQTFKVTSWGDLFADFAHDDTADDWADELVGPDDLAAFGAVIGHALASAHARGPTPDGGPALLAIAADLDGATDAFVAELVRDAAADRERSLADHALFRESLQEDGPLLGAATIVEDTP
jgi:uncharacterized protein (DUF2252 family)